MRPVVVLAGACVLLVACGQPPVQPAAPVQPSASASARPIVSTSAAPARASASVAPPASPESSGAAAAPVPTTAPPAPSVSPPAASAGAPSPCGAQPGDCRLPQLPASKRIGPLLFISQTLNNCGPASIAEILNFFGVQRTQAQVAAVLRPALPDYGMSLYGVPFYAESVGLRAAGAVAGNDQLIKGFVANGLPVIVADEVSRTDHTRHFRPIDGYNDQAGYFIGSDPYLGPNHQISYADFDDLWRISGNRWAVLYPPAKQDMVEGILARYGNRTAAVQAALQRGQQSVDRQPKLPWSWLELADAQIDAGNLQAATPNIEKGIQLGLPFEGHWLQMKLQRAGGSA